jgi:hypothetical protein
MKLRSLTILAVGLLPVVGGPAAAQGPRSNVKRQSLPPRIATQFPNTPVVQPSQQVKSGLPALPGQMPGVLSQAPGMPFPPSNMGGFAQGNFGPGSWAGSGSGLGSSGLSGAGPAGPGGSGAGGDSGLLAYNSPPNASAKPLASPVGGSGNDQGPQLGLGMPLKDDPLTPAMLVASWSRFNSDGKPETVVLSIRGDEKTFQFFSDRERDGDKEYANVVSGKWELKKQLGKQPVLTLKRDDGTVENWNVEIKWWNKEVAKGGVPIQMTLWGWEYEKPGEPMRGVAWDRKKDQLAGQTK